MKICYLKNISIATLFFFCGCFHSFAQRTAFSFGAEISSFVPDGLHSMRFRLAPSAAGTIFIGASLTNRVLVTAGRFVTTLDFGNLLDGSPRWVEFNYIKRNWNGLSQMDTQRVALLSVPYAIFANSASNFNGKISGDVTGTQNATVVTHVAGLTAAQIVSGATAANDLLKSQLGGNFFSGPSAGASDTGSDYHNTGIGDSALYSNSGGGANTAVGDGALFDNQTGNWNTGLGYYSLYANQTGGQNTAVGLYSLLSCVTNNYNTALGTSALSSTRGDNNIGIGAYAGQNSTTGNDNIDIGNQGDFYDDATIRIGDPSVQTRTFIAGIANSTISGGSAVFVDTATGRLGIESSSARFKSNIQNMGELSSLLFLLNPVVFQYKPELDPKGLHQFGLIAEQVEKVSPDLVVKDAKHGIYTVRYEAINAMLLNEFLKQHQTVEQQKNDIHALQVNITELKAMVSELLEHKSH
jgi:hypothetical protein